MLSNQTYFIWPHNAFSRTWLDQIRTPFLTLLFVYISEKASYTNPTLSMKMNVMYKIWYRQLWYTTHNWIENSGRAPTNTGRAPIDSGRAPTNSGRAPIDSGRSPIDQVPLPYIQVARLRIQDALPPIQARTRLFTTRSFQFIAGSWWDTNSGCAPTYVWNTAHNYSGNSSYSGRVPTTSYSYKCSNVLWIM